MQAESLTFPNPSRSYDESGHGVRFWGYDRTFEISFFVGQRALSRLDSTMASGEAALLGTFDVHRDRICKVAGDVYTRRRKASHIYSYVLTDSDF